MMHKSGKIRCGLMLLSVMLLAVSACGSGPPPRLYLLDATATTVLSDTVLPDEAVDAISALGMKTVELPGYASDVQLTGIDADGVVYQRANHRWAEEPADAITRLLAERLRHRAGATVLIEPWPRDFSPDARVEVLFDKLLREPMGGADMAGQILLLSGDGRRLLRSVPFHLAHYGRDIDEKVYFLAVAQGVDDIAQMAVQALIEAE